MSAKCCWTRASPARFEPGWAPAIRPLPARSSCASKGTRICLGLSWPVCGAGSALPSERAILSSKAPVHYWPAPAPISWNSALEAVLVSVPRVAERGPQATLRRPISSQPGSKRRTSCSPKPIQASTDCHPKFYSHNPLQRQLHTIAVWGYLMKVIAIGADHRTISLARPLVPFPRVGF